MLNKTDHKAAKEQAIRIMELICEGDGTDPRIALASLGGVVIVCAEQSGDPERFLTSMIGYLSEYLIKSTIVMGRQNENDDTTN